jgi:hypothetical protein
MQLGIEITKVEKELYHLGLHLTSSHSPLEHEHMNMKYLKKIKLASDDYQRYSKLDSI